jgi:hypothetical protein
MHAALARASNLRRFPARGFFETRKQAITRKIAATMEGTAAFETRFHATEADIAAVTQQQHRLVVDLFSYEVAAGERLVGRAEVPMAVLQGETWVEGTAPVHSIAYDGASCPCLTANRCSWSCVTVQILCAHDKLRLLKDDYTNSSKRMYKHHAQKLCMS